MAAASCSSSSSSSSSSSTMRPVVAVLLLLLLASSSAQQSLSVDGEVVVPSGLGGVGGQQRPSKPRPPQLPLFLTPLIEAGRVAEARELSKVPALLPTCCDSYAGFLTVDKQYGSNLLFWYFPAETQRATAPLVVWLQGGPGTSMIRPVFLENGPYLINTRTRKLNKRRGAWTRKHSMLYFDNPVGTGFSFARDPAGLSKNLEQISRSLVEALHQFFVLFPEQRERELYVAGESFGGKMAIGLSHTIHRLTSSPRPFRLTGVAVVNGLVEAESQLDKSDVAFHMGFVDEEGRDEMRALAAEQIRLIREGDAAGAMRLGLDECGGPMSPHDTGMAALTNVLLWNGTQDNGFADLAEHALVRGALHVGNVTFKARAEAVGRAVRDDLYVSVLPELGELADNYRVLVASGQMDLCLPYRLTAALLRKMAWQGAEDMARASRRLPWCVRGQLAGYARSTRGLTHVFVRNAGHYLGQDQPRWAADMLQRFTHQDSFDTCSRSSDNF